MKTEVLSSVKEVKSLHSNMSITEGQSLTLQANIPGASDIRWILNGVELANSEQYRYGVSGNDQTLTIRSVSNLEQGIIMCQAQTLQGLVKCQFDTMVTDKGAEAPHFLVQPKSQNVNEGQNVKFTSEIAGEPSPEVEWLKDNMNVSIYHQKVTVVFIFRCNSLCLFLCRFQSHQTLDWATPRMCTLWKYVKPQLQTAENTQ